MVLERLGIVVKLKAPENPSNAYQALKMLERQFSSLKKSYMNVENCFYRV